MLPWPRTHLTLLREAQLEEDQSGVLETQTKGLKALVSTGLRASPDLGNSMIKTRPKLERVSHCHRAQGRSVLPTLRAGLCLHIPIPSAPEMWTCWPFSERLEPPSTLSRYLVSSHPSDLSSVSSSGKTCQISFTGNVRSSDAPIATCATPS